ncbi:hypothetical protein [Shewanella litorisediminis]|nr:hypothetical protein [Shewanella litorisediminis]
MTQLIRPEALTMMNLKSAFALVLFAAFCATASANQDTTTLSADAIVFDTDALHESITTELTLSMAKIQDELRADNQGATLLLANQEEAKSTATAAKAE